MVGRANFLCEIGTEEVPAGYLPPAISSIKRDCERLLKEHRIAFDRVEVYATPRRIAILGEGLASRQSEDELELKGPSRKAAYDAQGNPTKALEGFLKANQLQPGDVFVKTTEKGEYVHAVKKTAVKNTAEIVPGIVEAMIKNTAFPKKMRWSDKKVLFPRPISYFCVILDNAVVPLEISGIVSSNRTRGHYVRFNRMVEVESVAQYGECLRRNGVIVDHGERKDLIRRGLLQAASSVNGELVEDDELLETVTFLTEGPSVVVCEFDKRFLNIPDVVLITEMREHQKYFAVRDAGGGLLPYFLVVSNNPPTSHVKTGNERVITARFTDAQFFFDEDRKTPLAAKVESLKSVLFHKDLGSIFNKVERMIFIADLIGDRIGLESRLREKISRALLLCKADLNTAMVFEFTSLQGKIGKIYALLDGEDREVAGAIEDHYRPRSQDDPLPDSLVSVTVSLAEKIDNIFGSYSVGNIPKGSQDPYALRRQANAIVEMCVKSGISLDMRDVLQCCARNYNRGDDHIGPILKFISARANTVFTEAGLRYDEIDACLSVEYYNYLELYRYAKSLHDFRRNEGFSEMLLSFKRMNNIVSAFRQKNPEYLLEFDAGRLEEQGEKDLFNFFDSRRTRIDEFIESSEYTALFGLLIEGKGVIDAFFDSVMVMDGDASKRDNRLALLDLILRPFKNLIDFSKISE